MGTKSIKAMNSDEFLSFLDEALSTKTTKSAEAAFYSHLRTEQTRIVAEMKKEADESINALNDAKQLHENKEIEAMVGNLKSTTERLGCKEQAILELKLLDEKYNAAFQQDKESLYEIEHLGMETERALKWTRSIIGTMKTENEGLSELLETYTNIQERERPVIAELTETTEEDEIA